MADDWQEYVNDPRTVCKYGPTCYQKNPEHHKNFKHPPVKRKDVNRQKRRYSPYTRSPGRQSPGTNSNKADEEFKEPSEASKSSEESNERVHKDETTECIKLPEDLKFYDKNTDKSIFKQLFLVEMPDDFFNFYEFLNGIGKSAEETMASVNLELIGPYDLLLGKLPILEQKEYYLIHWRFFYDPPEFQTPPAVEYKPNIAGDFTNIQVTDTPTRNNNLWITQRGVPWGHEGIIICPGLGHGYIYLIFKLAILKKKKGEYHIGYFRDTPEQKSALLASNDSAKDCHITLMSENLFGAVYKYLENEKKSSPFTALNCQKLMSKIKTYAEENSISLEEYSMKKRLKQTVTKSFHGAGVAVPYDKKTQLGYRHLVETDANLKKMFASLQNAKSQTEKDKIFSDLQVVITNASIALDESDFGTGLELGIDLFCSGLKELHGIALSMFTSAYGVLSRKAFAEIAEAHLKYRRKGPKMSLLSSEK